MNNCSSFRNFILTLLVVVASAIIPAKETRPNDMPEVIITPIGEVEEDILNYLKGKLSGEFSGKEIIIGKSISLDKGAYNSERRQFLSEPILKSLEYIEKDREGRILGVVDVDLYTQGLNFIFGQASFTQGACLISLARLRQEFYGLRPNKELFYLRTLKEAVHELGHTYGLRHCEDKRCVMHFSNSLLDTDYKDYNFCPICKDSLKRCFYE